jgi:hypothetical protein
VRAEDSTYLQLLKNRIGLHRTPFSDRGSRLLVFLRNHSLEVRLAERWFKREGQLSSYRQRPPIVDRWALTDASGSPLRFEPVTYPHCVECQASIGTFRLMFVDPETLMLWLPDATCGVSFRVAADSGEVDRRGGILRVTGEIRRSVVYTTNAPVVENSLIAGDAGTQEVRLRVGAGQGGAAILVNITPRLGFNRYLPDPQLVLDAAARVWHDWFAAAPHVDDFYQAQYYYAWWIMRAGLISSRFYTTREAMTPSKLHYVGVWQWDAFFHALAYRHVDRRLARDQIRILLDHQRPDGMIPDAVHDEGTVTHLTFPIDADVTKPPLIAWAAWKLYESDGDREFLDEIYEPIIRWNSWWFDRNDFDADGLCEYLHPFSSGLDDSPLWDEGMPVTSPDLNTYLFLQQEAMGRIASVLGLKDDAELWQGRAERMAQRLISRLWDPESGLFWPKRGEKQILIPTPFSLFPLLTGRLPAQIVDRLVGHLTDEDEFWTRYPVPTVARSDPRYDPEQMWRGPTWVNVNYLLIEGLERSGRGDLASELRRRTLEMVMAHTDIYEYYHPETAAPGARAASIYGWSAALFIDLALQASAQSKHPLRAGLA